jgi:hypothetical protein
VLLATRTGKCIRFALDDVRVFASRNSTGVRGIRLESDNTVIAMAILAHVEATPDERAALELLSAPAPVGMHVISQGPVTTANNPSAAVLARFPAARRYVVAATADSADAQPAPAAALATPPRLRTSVIDGNTLAVRTALVNPGANPHEPDRAGRSLLHHALENGHLGVALALLQAAAAPNSPAARSAPASDRTTASPPASRAAAAASEHCQCGHGASGQFAGDEGAWWQELVFATDDQKVDKIRRCGLDVHQDLSGGSHRVGHGFNDQVFDPTKFSNVHCTHAVVPRWLMGG